ncbi:MAG TPA: sensor histidine kinase [Actinocatenispora sp.]
MIVDRGWLALDVAAAALVSAVCGYAVLESGRGGWFLLAAAAVGLPVCVRRRWPVPAAGLVLAAALTCLVTGVVPMAAAPAPYAAVALTHYQVGARVGSRLSVATVVAATVFAILALTWLAPSHLPPGHLPPGYLASGYLTPGYLASGWRAPGHLGSGAGPAVLVAAMLATPWAVGRYVRSRRSRAARAGARLAERAVTDERLRIARDMHDVVAHNLSLIAVKSSVARHVALVRPEESQNALAVIETASRDALVELRRALGLLRDGTDRLAPTGSADDLRELVRRAEQAGVDVTASLHRPELPPDGVRLAVYRIVQEALTNVVRHAGPTRCRLTVDADAAAVTVEVSDDGPVGTVAASPGSGHGLRGMRERVTAYGGTLDTTRRDGGFRVAARIPYAATGAGGQP